MKTVVSLKNATENDQIIMYLFLKFWNPKIGSFSNEINNNCLLNLQYINLKITKNGLKILIKMLLQMLEKKVDS